ncbi:hypothetical protein HDU99_008033, partial [Rhizoclosmatium hyalinum]
FLDSSWPFLDFLGVSPGDATAPGDTWTGLTISTSAGFPGCATCIFSVTLDAFSSVYGSFQQGVINIKQLQLSLPIKFPFLDSIVSLAKVNSTGIWNLNTTVPDVGGDYQCSPSGIYASIDVSTLPAQPLDPFFAKYAVGNYVVQNTVNLAVIFRPQDGVNGVSVSAQAQLNILGMNFGYMAQLETQYASEAETDRRMNVLSVNDPCSIGCSIYDAYGYCRSGRWADVFIGQMSTLK